MKQPSRKVKKKNPNEVTGTGLGIETCNECPFMLIKEGQSFCNASDVVLGEIGIVYVPKWCGNNKEYGKGIQGKK